MIQPLTQGPHASGLAADYAALEDGAGLVDLGPRTSVLLSGPDAAGFLNRFATQKLDDLQSGAGRETFLTDAKGHVLAWALVFAQAEGLRLDTDAGQAQAVIEHLSFYRIREKLEFHDQSAARREMLVAGPHAESTLARVMSEALPQAPLDHVEALCAGHRVWLSRIELGGRAAFLAACEAESAAAVHSAILGAGACAGARPAWEAVRIESGWPCYGRDITRANLPQEVGRDSRAISFRKGCYLGQETVARLDARGHVNRTLCGLRFEGSDVPPDGTELAYQGRPAGHVTSAAYSPGFGTVVALGYVRREHSAPSTRLESPFGPAVVTALPMSRS